MLETLDAAAVRRWCGGGLAALRAHQHEIDELNVFPVPDGDTGTNLVLTLTSAQEALESFLAVAPEQPRAGGERLEGTGGQALLDPALSDRALSDRALLDGVLSGEVVDRAEPVATPLGKALRRMARGALLGARGNSGVIVSQLLRGMADSLATSAAVRGGELARALRKASEAAYGAVARPVEGTVLSVAAAAAEGAGRIKSDDLQAVARAAALAAREALARTPQQLPALARAGVVDAGGRGLCLLLDALVEALTPAGKASKAEAASAAGAPVVSAAASDAPVVSGAASSAPVVSGAASGAPVVSGAASSAPVVSGAASDVPVVSGVASGAPVVSGAASDAPAVSGAASSAPAMSRPDADSAMSGALEVERIPEANGTASGAPDGGLSTVSAPDLPARAISARAEATADGPAAPVGEVGSQRYGYEVQYLLDATDAAVDVLKATLDGLGDSLVVVGTGDGMPPTWNVHVHVEAGNIGPAMEAGVRAGRPHRISVTPLDERTRHHETETEAEEKRPTRGAVVVAAGDGLAALFEAEGATVVGRNPSTGEMLAAIEATRCTFVVLLPNDANTQAVAIEAAREAGRHGVRVSVVPTRSPVQALAALAVRDPGKPFADDVIAMAEAAGACRYGEVCTAQRNALTVAGPCREGDLLGLVDGEVHVIGADLEDVSRQLFDRMLGGGGELATLVLGADVPASLEETLRGHAAQAWPFVELQCYAGGQPRYHLLVGVE